MAECSTCHNTLAFRKLEPEPGFPFIYPDEGWRLVHPKGTKEDCDRIKTAQLSRQHEVAGQMFYKQDTREFVWRPINA